MVFSVAVAFSICGCSQHEGNIYHAIQAGDLDSVEALLESNPDLLNAAGPDGLTPLHSASLWGKRKVAEFLLAQQANVNARNEQGRTPLHWATACDHVALVELLLTHGADPRATDHRGRAPLHAVAAVGPTFKPSLGAAELLLSHGADINARDKDEWTALHLAASNSHLEFCGFLIAKGAECDIYAASALGELDRVIALLEKEPDLVMVPDACGLMPMHWAAARGKSQVVELLLAGGAAADPLSNREGWTPMQRAAANGYTDVVSILLAHGADANALAQDGRSMLQRANTDGHFEIAKLLVRYGAK